MVNSLKPYVKWIDYFAINIKFSNFSEIVYNND